MSKKQLKQLKITKMKNLYKIFRIQLVLAVVLLCASTGFAQSPVIRVPATCNVVVAGTGVGAVTGPGGQVGNGGVVCMPDPYAADIFTYIPNGTTVVKWIVVGDLSFATTTLPLYGNAIPSAAGTQVKIQSYNENYRTSEAYPDPTWARSKGRVTVAYSATCGGSITFDVYKVYAPTVALVTGNPAIQPTNVPKIVGNTTCLLPSKQYTYSVDQIASDNANDAIGFDSYYWSGLPAGATINYYSADFSSITFTTGTIVPTTSTLKCCYGRVNPTWDGGVSNYFGGASHQTCVSIELVPAPVAPAFSATTLSSAVTTLNSGLTGCLQTGQNSFTVTYPNPPIGTTYTWSVINTGWSFSNNTTATTTTTFSGIDNNPGEIKLTVNNGSCNPVSFIYQINRTFVSTGTIPLVISPANTCVLAGSSTSFSINGLGNGTTWTILPSLGTGTYINPTTVGSSMVLNLPSTATGAYTLTATGNTTGTYLTCGGSISTSIYIKPVAPSIPSGATCVVRNGGVAQTYTCSTVTGATGYQWSFPSGWSASTVTTTLPTVTIIPNGNTNSGSVSVVALGVTGSGCNSASSPTLAINYSVIAPTITEKPSCYNVNMSSLVTVNVTNAPNPFFGAYTVTLTPAGATTTPASTPNYAVASSVVFSNAVSPNTISFNTTDTLANIISNPTIVSPPPGTYDLWITFNTGASGGTCTATASTKIQIIIPPANTATLGYNYTPGTSGSDLYFVNSAPAGSTYIWHIGNNVILGANNNSISLLGNAGLAGRVSVDVTPLPATIGTCSSITRLISVSGATHGLKQAPPIKVTKNLDGVVVYPNPSAGNFTIELENVKQAAFGILTDMNGKQIAVYLLQKGENNLQNEGLAKGTYILSINIDGVNQAKKIVIK
jgi:hypothetical protein